MVESPLSGGRELVALLKLCYWCLVAVSVLSLFLMVPCVGLQCVIVVLYSYLLVFLIDIKYHITYNIRN